MSVIKKLQQDRKQNKTYLKLKPLLLYIFTTIYTIEQSMATLLCLLLLHIYILNTSLIFKKIHALRSSGYGQWLYFSYGNQINRIFIYHQWCMPYFFLLRVYPEKRLILSILKKIFPSGFFEYLIKVCSSWNNFFVVR